MCREGGTDRLIENLAGRLECSFRTSEMESPVLKPLVER